MCRFDNYPDLNQDNAFVRNILKTWVQQQVKNFRFDGIRVGFVPEVKRAFWSEFAQSAGVFAIGDANSSDPQYVASF